MYELARTDNVRSVTAAATLDPSDTVVLIDTSGGAFTLTMPPVDQCAGRHYSLYLVAGATTACTVQASGTSAYADSDEWGGDYTMDAADDRILFYCDGRMFWEVNEDIA
jgi:hypothetical protein